MDEVKFYMDESLVTVAAEASVSDAAKIMRDHKVGSLLVVQGEVHVGIITEGDLSRKVIAADISPQEIRVIEVMTQPIISIDSNQTMAVAFIHMNKKHIRHLAITESDTIKGMLSIKDFGNYYANKFGKSKKKN